MSQPPRVVAPILTRIRTGAVLGVALLVLALSSGPVQASTPIPKFGLGISPTRLVVNAGQLSSVQRFTVSNQGSETLNIVVTDEGFTTATNGSLQYAKTAPYSAATWLSATPARFSIPGRSRQEVSIRITVPSTPEPGDHQVALMFVASAGKTADNISIDRGVAVPVYITVPGVISSTAKVIALHAPAFAVGGPISITSTVQDTGTVHRDFRAPNSLFAGVDGHNIAFPDFIVGRGATRDIQTTWNPPLFCLCHVRVAIMNADGVTSSQSVRVIVFPLWWVLAILGLILLLGVGSYLTRRRYRRNVAAAARALNGAAAGRHELPV